MSHAEQHTPDERTPQQLSTAILDHELDPASGETPAMTFRNILLGEEGTPAEKPQAKKVLFALQSLEKDPTDIQRESLMHMLTVVSHVRAESMKFQAEGEVAANPLAALKSPQHRQAAQSNLFGSSHSDQLRASMEGIAEEFGTALHNLDEIEQLMRTLAAKLLITLIEPGIKK